MITWMKNVTGFQIEKVQGICLIFCQFQPGAAYKSVAYKKKRVCAHEIYEMFVYKHTETVEYIKK